MYLDGFDGYDVGVTEGTLDGNEDGIDDGCMLGTTEGTHVGTDDGCILGTHVGTDEKKPLVPLFTCNTS